MNAKVMKKFFQEKWLPLAVAAIAFSQLLNLAFILRNNYVIHKNNELKAEVDNVKTRTGEIMSSIVHGVDLGVRGYALTSKEQLLDPFTQALKQSPSLFAGLEDQLKSQGYPEMEKFNAVRKEVESYIAWSATMVGAVRAENMDQFRQMLSLDKGYEVWVKFDAFQKPLQAFENALYEKAEAEYASAMRANLYLQIAIAVLFLPLLFVILYRIRKERREKEILLNKVLENDRKYVFNPGTESQFSADQIIQQTIANTRKASDVIKQMAGNNYEVNWEGLDEKNIVLNSSTLAGDLMNLKAKLKRVKQEDERRNWMNEGLASFSELVRNHQHDHKVLADQCVSYLSRYLNCQQASLFILQNDGTSEQHLELASTWAFNRKKYMEKRIDPGVGLVGQAFLEGDIIQLKEVPEGYTEITSGLGDATPRYLCIVPVKYDVNIVGVLELAAFGSFEPHYLQFLQKACEFLASAILNTQNTIRMKDLLEQAKINEEQMKQREEEMRQNMEELQATQEELVRKEREMQKRMRETSSYS